MNGAKKVENHIFYVVKKSKMENSLAPFQGDKIRKIWHNEEWFFSVVDVVEVLTDSPMPKRYWTDLKRRSEKESGQGYAFCVPLKLTASDGRQRLTDCANTEGVLRIIISIPSPKAEPFKLWLAGLGKREFDEIENPELLTERQRAIYKAKGYSDEWIKERLQNIDTRKRLTAEWKNRGVKEGQEYSILTAVISKGTFGVNPSEHAKLKGLEKQNLRDHMTPLELIFTSLGEELTREKAVEENAQGFDENKSAATKGGTMAGKALKTIEKDRGKKVLSATNFLPKKNEDTGELPESPKETKP